MKIPNGHEYLDISESRIIRRLLEFFKLCQRCSLSREDKWLMRYDHTMFRECKFLNQFIYLSLTDFLLNKML